MTGASVFLLSFNKKDYVLDAIRSVLDQTSNDWELWILENSTDGETREVIHQSGVLDDHRIIYTEINLSDKLRRSCYPPALLLNRAYPLANGEYIFYVSDDDLLAPKCIETCVSYLNSHPDQGVCYFSLLIMGIIAAPGFAPAKIGIVHADIIRGCGNVDGAIDSGQIVHRKSCLDKLEQPFFEESANPNTARHADGLFMISLAHHYPFYPISKVLATHRYTPIYTWTTYDRGTVKAQVPIPMRTTVAINCKRCGQPNGELWLQISGYSASIA